MFKKFNDNALCDLLQDVHIRILDEFEEIENGEKFEDHDKIIIKYNIPNNNFAFFVIAYANADHSYDPDINETGYAIQFLIQNYDEPEDSNIVMQEYFVLLDERAHTNGCDDFVWYCVNFDNKYPGSMPGRTYKRKRLSPLETKFMTSYRDILKNASNVVFRDFRLFTKPDGEIHISHYNYYTEATRKNGIPAPILPNYKEIIDEFNELSLDEPTESVSSQQEQNHDCHTDDDNYIKMDGEYHEFEGGAIRYTKTGKGKFDLIPWETMKLVTDKIINDDLYKAYITEMDVLIALSQKDAVEVIINITAVKYGEGMFSADAFAWMLRDLAVHYEKGAEKYGVDNWKKGIPASSFWDSGCRHTCQFINGLEDEPHWISAIWNMLGYLWTINNKD